MQYIILDLEWNQPLSYQSRAYRQYGGKLIFEMIQIGAVKVDESLKVCDTISVPIRPQIYTKIHPRIRRMTGLTNELLDEAQLFPEAMDTFVKWCGEDYALLTWGCDDVSVLKQNMDFYNSELKLPPLCDIQRLFSDVHQCRDRKGLKAAMEMLSIEPDENLPFHNALHDSYYTALVFATLPDPAAVLKYPQAPKQLIHQDKLHTARVKGSTYASVTEALNGDEALKPRCPACGRVAETEEGGYVRQTGDKYVHLARCRDHGPLLLRARLRPEEEGRCLLSLSVSKASASNVAYVHTKRLQMAEKTAVDPDEALLNADRTSMPFED